MKINRGVKIIGSRSKQCRIEVCNFINSSFPLFETSLGVRNCSIGLPCLLPYFKK